MPVNDSTMANRTFKCIVFLIVVLFSQECRGIRPEVIPDTNEIVQNEGDPLTITCTGHGSVFFSYPVDIDERVETSEPQIAEEKWGDLQKYIFRRPSTIHGDTGWYGCADHYFEPTVNEYDDPTIRWIYVYVKSNTSFFVEADLFESIREVQYRDVIIPCRPTSPHYNVTLHKDLQPVKLGEKVSFDPRIGFTLHNLTLRDGGYFKCVIEYNDVTQTVEHPLIVFRKLELPKPKIMDDTLHHVTQGQTLYINCTILLDADIQYAIDWKTPQQSSRITSHPYSMVDGNTREVISELTVKDVEYADEGEYHCIIQAPFNVTNSDTKYLKIYDPKIKYINLTSVDSGKVSQRKLGDRIQWVVNVDAYPKPRFKWLNWKGEEIVGNWMDSDNAKHAINYTLNTIIFRINQLDSNDMGVYTLQAVNDGEPESLNFTLEVLAKPVPIIIDRMEAYYVPNQTVVMHCHVAAFPAPNITWFFLNCPLYPLLNNSTMVDLTNVTQTSEKTRFESIAIMNIEMSGHVTCTACNVLGCDSATENMLVSDGNGSFGILEPREAITEGDKVELICAASIYNYSSVIRWLDDDEEPIVGNDRVKIREERTAFTYRSILTIDTVEKSDSMYYTCAGTPLDAENLLERVRYHLNVHEPLKPFIKETNLNETEIVIDLGTDGHRTIKMQCFVGGMPEPNLTWYKDDNIIEENEQYFFRHKHQELYIKYLLEKDNGKYICRAENRLGRAENHQTITIKSTKANPKGLIISIIILGIILIALAIYFTIKIRRERRIRKELMEAGLMHFEEGALECLNPELTVDDQAELLPYDRKWEFPRERLKIGIQLGSGAFGVVAKAEAHGICDNETVTTVAVKMVRHTTDPTYVRALASELKIMVHLGKHLNVVNLLGACTKNISKRELLVIVEYCRYGNLHNYLLRNRKTFINQIDPVSGKFDPSIGIEQLNRSVSVSSNNRIKYAALSFSRSLSVSSDAGLTQEMDSQGVCMSPDGCILSNNSIQPGWRSNYRGDYKDNNLKPICTQDLLSWAFQVSRGMEYLSQRRVLHGDLAARNILLAENNVVKICDFGLAKTMYKDDNYKKKADGPLPIKWMAIESIRDRIFSTQSDIWSFGIVLWEFFTLAETPYPGMEAEKLYQKLIEGYRMEQPEYATKEVYNIMLQCWKAKPTLRPSFTDLVNDIGGLLEESVRSHYVSLNDPYIDMNTVILGDGKSDYLTMMSAPDHAALSSPTTNDYVNSPLSPAADINTPYLCMSPSSQNNDRYESGIFSPRPSAGQSHFDFPSPGSDLEDAVEMSPMLKKSEEDPYLKPIDVNQRRAEFARQKQSMRNNQQTLEERDRDSGYCNAPKNLHLIDLNEFQNADEPQRENSSSKKTDFAPAIIKTVDNYVNMPKQKDDLRRDIPDGFSNPSYVIVPNNHQNDQTRV